jgi:acyl-CoA thioester hydrolase
VDLSPLPISHRATILEDYIDEMGHMNVMWYTHFFDRATMAFFESFGMGLAYFEGENAGAFALEKHTRYLAEARPLRCEAGLSAARLSVSISCTS